VVNHSSDLLPARPQTPPGSYCERFATSNSIEMLPSQATQSRVTSVGRVSSSELAYDVCTTCKVSSNYQAFAMFLYLNGLWWAQQDSNLRLPPCEGGDNTVGCTF